MKYYWWIEGQFCVKFYRHFWLVVPQTKTWLSEKAEFFTEWNESSRVILLTNKNFSSCLQILLTRSVSSFNATCIYLTNERKGKKRQLKSLSRVLHLFIQQPIKYTNGKKENAINCRQTASNILQLTAFTANW